MKFYLMIESQDAAFCGGGRDEVARLLLKAAGQVADGGDCNVLVDYNGNKCGEWTCNDQKPDFFELEAADLFKLADDYAIALDDDPRKLSRAELIEGLESIGVACFDEEPDSLLADAYGDSMLAGDLGSVDRTDWPDALQEAWEQ